MRRASPTFTLLLGGMSARKGTNLAHFWYFVEKPHEIKFFRSPTWAPVSKHLKIFTFHGHFQFQF